MILSEIASNTEPMEIETGDQSSLPIEETPAESSLPAATEPAPEAVEVLQITPSPTEAIQLSILQQLQTLTATMGQVQASVSELKPTPAPEPEPTPAPAENAEETAPPRKSRKRSLLRKILM